MKKLFCTNKNINSKDNNVNKCVHEFVRDLIDITPDKSIEITYCILCEYTLTDTNTTANTKARQKN